MTREVLLVGAGLVCSSVFAADVNLGVADVMALDQPRVVFTLTLPGTDTEVGPNYDNIGFLDTGANGLLLSAGAYDQETNPQKPFTPALRSDGTPVVYYESGVAGYEELTVYR